MRLVLAKVVSESNFWKEKADFTVSAAIPENVPPQLLLRVIEGKDVGKVINCSPGSIAYCRTGSKQIYSGGSPGVSHSFRREATPTGFVLVDEKTASTELLSMTPTRITRLELRGGEILRLSDTRIQVETSPLGDATSCRFSSTCGSNATVLPSESTTTPVYQVTIGGFAIICPSS